MIAILVPFDFYAPFNKLAPSILHPKVARYATYTYGLPYEYRNMPLYHPFVLCVQWRELMLSVLLLEVYLIPIY